MPAAPQKPLSFSMGRQVAKPVAQEMMKRLVTSTHETVRALSKAQKSATTPQAAHGALLAKRIMGGTAPSSLSHQMMRKGIQTVFEVDRAKREKGESSIVKMSKRGLENSSDMGHVERVLGKEAVSHQAPIADDEAKKAAMRSRMAGIYVRERAKEEGQEGVLAAGREKIQEILKQGDKEDASVAVLEDARRAPQGNKPKGPPDSKLPPANLTLAS